MQEGPALAHTFDHTIGDGAPRTGRSRFSSPRMDSCLRGNDGLFLSPRLESHFRANDEMGIVNYSTFAAMSMPTMTMVVTSIIHPDTSQAPVAIAE